MSSEKGRRYMLIELTPHEHKLIRISAIITGKSVKDMLLEYAEMHVPKSLRESNRENEEERPDAVCS